MNSHFSLINKAFDPASVNRGESASISVDTEYFSSELLRPEQLSLLNEELSDRGFAQVLKTACDSAEALTLLASDSTIQAVVFPFSASVPTIEIEYVLRACLKKVSLSSNLHELFISSGSYDESNLKLSIDNFLNNTIGLDSRSAEQLFSEFFKQIAGPAMALQPNVSVSGAVVTHGPSNKRPWHIDGVDLPPRAVVLYPFTDQQSVRVCCSPDTISDAHQIVNIAKSFCLDDKELQKELLASLNEDLVIDESIIFSAPPGWATAIRAGSKGALHQGPATEWHRLSLAYFQYL